MNERNHAECRVNVVKLRLGESKVLKPRALGKRRDPPQSFQSSHALSPVSFVLSMQKPVKPLT